MESFERRRWTAVHLWLLLDGDSEIKQPGSQSHRINVGFQHVIIAVNQLLLRIEPEWLCEYCGNQFKPL